MFRVLFGRRVWWGNLLGVCRLWMITVEAVLADAVNSAIIPCASVRNIAYSCRIAASIFFIGAMQIHQKLFQKIRKIPCKFHWLSFISICIIILIRLLCRKGHCFYLSPWRLEGYSRCLRPFVHPCFRPSVHYPDRPSFRLPQYIGLEYSGLSTLGRISIMDIANSSIMGIAAR